MGYDSAPAYLAFLVLLAAAVPQPASAATPDCNTHLTSDTTYVFDKDLICNGGGIATSVLFANNRHNVTVDCAGYRIVNNGTWNYGIRIGLSGQPSQNITIRNCEIVNISTGSVGRGISLAGTSSAQPTRNIIIADTKISLNTTDFNYMGIVGSYLDDVAIDNVSIRAAGTNIDMSGVSGLLVTGCDLEASTSASGIMISSSSGSGSNATVEDCDISGCGNGIYLIQYPDMHIIGSRLAGNWNGVSVLGLVDGLEISRNDITNSHNVGILTYWTTTPDSNFTISHNNITGTTDGDGIEFGNKLEDSVISFNNVSGNAGDGIDMGYQPAGANLTLLNNTVCDNSQDDDDHYDIRGDDGVAGDDNTCETTSNYADEGRFVGCDTSCSGCVDNDTDGFYAGGGCVGPLDCNDADAGVLPAKQGLVVDRDMVICADTYYAYTDEWGESSPMFIMDTDNVTLDCNGSFFHGDYEPGEDDLYFIETMADNITVANCTVINYETGVESDGSNAAILDNTFINVSDAARVRNGSTVSRNGFTSVWRAVYVRGSDCTITNNVMDRVAIGVWLRGSLFSAVSNNVIDNRLTQFVTDILDEEGDPYTTWGILLGDSWMDVNNNTVFNNTVDFATYGIMLGEEDAEVDFNNITANNVDLCDFGIYINVSSGNTLNDNWVCYCDEADIYVESKSDTDTGDGNTCQNVVDWADTTAGPTGCTDPCELGPEEEEEPEEEDEESHGGATYYMFGTGTVQPPQPPAQPPSGTPSGGAVAGGGQEVIAPPNLTPEERPEQPLGQGAAAAADPQSAPLTPATHGADLSWPLWPALIVIAGIVYLFLVKERKAAKKTKKRKKPRKVSGLRAL